MDWNAQISHIQRSLPGLTLWMQCAPVPDDVDYPVDEGVGLAIQRESGPKGRWYEVVFFRLVPDEGALAPDGDFLPGRGEETSDWVVDVGYRGEHDALEGAIEDAKGLARDLPPNPIFRTRGGWRRSSTRSPTPRTSTKYLQRILAACHQHALLD